MLANLDQLVHRRNGSHIHTDILRLYRKRLVLQLTFPKMGQKHQLFYPFGNNHRRFGRSNDHYTANKLEKAAMTAAATAMRREVAARG